MHSVGVDLVAVIRRLADRRRERTEANVQADLHLFLDAAPLNLDDDQLDDIVLEQQAGGQRRIDVEVGSTVFEVKRDLRVGNVRSDAVGQLAGYVRSRTEVMGRRYVGVLTDGCEWHVYRPRGSELVLASSLTLNALEPDVDTLVVWLEAVLGTADSIPPQPSEIRRRLGAQSPAFLLDVADLADLYASCKDAPEVVLKRQLWSRLLFSALGTNFTDDDELFVAHTYLVLVAELVAHAVVDIDLTDPRLDVEALLSGEQFTLAGIGGVVEADFFDWPADAPGGDAFVRNLGRRISRFDWNAVAHDVLKTLYESVIDEGTRHRLGEYYTPDWLAEHIVTEVVDDPLTQRVVDPSCGSGTFLFWSIRRYLDAAAAEGMTNADAVSGVADHVVGIDLHPVAVTLARVTYLLAIGAGRLQDERRPFSVPVYLGDSIQLAEDTSILNAGGITIPTTADQQELFARQIHFPSEVVANAASFDALVTELAERARTRSARNTPLPIAAVMNRAQIAPEHREIVENAYRILCSLHDERRNHVWGYYIRNLARPVWLSQGPNRADRLVGNPPWLRFNAMNAAMQQSFKRLSTERGLWAGGAVATSQDLAALFVARATELYLKAGGRFGFVMPASTLSRSHYAGFRSATWSTRSSDTTVAFTEPWDLSGVSPEPFPVPAAVLFGERTSGGSASALEPTALKAVGGVRNHHHTWSEIRPLLSWTSQRTAVDDTSDRGFYGDMMRQGSNLVPRVLFMVDEQPPPAMGLPATDVAVASHRIPDEREPWKSLPTLVGVVERKFVRRVHLGETLMPFRLLEPLRAVIPFLDGRILDGTTAELDDYPSLAGWWRRAEHLWMTHRSETTRIALSEQIDFQSKLSIQHPPASIRVLYTGRGSRVAAAVETDTTTVVDHALYWSPVSSIEEGRYLVGLLNSDELHRRTEEYYSRGLIGARNIHKAAFGVSIPAFDPSNALHKAIVETTVAAEIVAASVSPSATVTSRRRAAHRSALDAAGVMNRLNEQVRLLIPPPAS